MKDNKTAKGIVVGNDCTATDAEFIERFNDFAFGKVVEQVKVTLNTRTRYYCRLAALIGCQASEVFRELLPKALEGGVTPVEVKEMIYQSTIYLGMGRVLPFLRIANEVLKDKGVALPLPSQAQVTEENCREAGIQAWVDCFGEEERDFWKAGPDDIDHLNKWLADNCFGAYYTRSGLTLRERELATFCFLSALGGCEPQLTGHIEGNLRVGNDKDFLIAVITNNLPFIGFPRTLNAISCIREAQKTSNK